MIMTEKITSLDVAVAEKRESISGEYHYEYIKERELAFMKLVKRLMPHIEQGEYGVLVGDDTSARVFTLAMKRVMEKISGVEMPTRFYPGTDFHYDDDWPVQISREERNNFLNSLRRSPFMARVLDGIRRVVIKKEQKALLLTEATCLGYTNRAIMFVLESECSMVADLAIVDFANDPVKFADKLGFLLRRIQHGDEDISARDDAQNQSDTHDRFGKPVKAGGKYFKIQLLPNKTGIEMSHDGHSHLIFYSRKTEDQQGAPYWGDSGASGVVKPGSLEEEYRNPNNKNYSETWSRRRFLDEYDKRYRDTEPLLLDVMKKVEDMWGPDYEKAQQEALSNAGISNDEYLLWYYHWWPKKESFGPNTEKTLWGREDAKLLAERTLRALGK